MIPSAPPPSPGAAAPSPPADRGFPVMAFTGAATMFLVQPPADLWLLAWLAPLPWLGIVQAERLAARRPWLVLWAAGAAHWLATIHWLRLPHPATALGWLALSAYLGIYLPLFVAVARRLVHGRGWPLVVAAPLAWMACEHVRGSFLEGFSFGNLGHTQWRFTTLLQLADSLGAVGVGGVVMTVAAAVAEAVAAARGPDGRRAVRRRAAASAGAAAALLAAAVAYGAWRLAGAPPASGRPLDVLLVQGSIDTELKHEPGAAADVARHYDELTMAALAAGGTARPDLIAWPETMWRWGLLEIDPDEELPGPVVEQALAGLDAATGARADRQALARRALEQERLDLLAAYARRYGTNWLVGIDRQALSPRFPGGARNYNCGLFLDAAGTPLACYDKMHPVLFGEYVPLGDRLPWLYRLTPLPAGLTPGKAPVAVEIAGRRVAANICYETALPEAVRGLVRELDRRGGRPDIIVNLTNDGWFWGSSELDMHLTAAIFRAVEVRTPLLIAANTGFSAWIDGSGRLLARGPRRATGTVRARVVPDGRTGPWLAWGSLPLWGIVAVVGAALPSWRGGARSGRAPRPHVQKR